MPFKRPTLPHEPSSGFSSRSESTPDPQRRPKRPRTSQSAKIFPSVKVYIVQAKIDGETLAELFQLVERHCERLLEDAEDADVIITAVTMRKRFERHVSWELAVSIYHSNNRTTSSSSQKTKAIVKPAWLRDSIAEGEALLCEPYVALLDLREQTIRNCPTCDKEPCQCEDTDIEEVDREDSYPSPPASAGSVSHTTPSPERKRLSEKKTHSHVRDIHSKLKLSKAEVESPTSTYSIPEHLLPPSRSVPTDTSRLNHASKYACQRASLLVCPNQALAAELDIIKRSRALEGEERSALSYSRAISVIKGELTRVMRCLLLSYLQSSSQPILASLAQLAKWSIFPT